MPSWPGHKRSAGSKRRWSNDSQVDQHRVDLYRLTEWKNETPSPHKRVGVFFLVGQIFQKSKLPWKVIKGRGFPL